MTQSTISSICVYCGSRFGNDPAFKQAAGTVGTRIGLSGRRLVYGAGSIGLMGVVAQSTMAAGGDVLGVIPDHLDDVEITQNGLSELHITEDMHQRKRMMYEQSDAFLLLAGGLGSLDETFEMLTWAQLGLHTKPIIVVNTLGYWDKLLDLIQHISANGFAAPENAKLLQVAPTPEAAFEILEACPPQSKHGVPIDRHLLP